MTETLGTSGLILNEPLLWERGKKGRCGYSMPPGDVPEAPLPAELTGGGPDFPDLSEVEVVRHYTRLSTWNFGVDTGLYPLGSCTMKYNPKTNERQAALPGFSSAHPLLPAFLCQGALRLMAELERDLAEITGLDAVTLQPAAGAQGELTGMLVLHAWHRSRGRQRTKIFIPDTAHGTNPASAALCGYAPVPVPSDGRGVLDPSVVAGLMDEDTAGIMITNPNTLGLFEENIREIARIVHDKGGLLYGDGANMNAVMGVVKPGQIGVDILHLNLHKTFSTPHGGGGPGAGPVAVRKDLARFLPVPRVVERDGLYELREDFPDSVGRVLAFHGHFGVLVRAYSYIRSMGPEGLKMASRLAVLNANYVRERLKGTLHLAFDRPCMHECVFSDQDQQASGIMTLDIAKRLMDYGYHPPTIYFPLVVHGALMIEPTETESKEDLDRFIEALQAIAKEAAENPQLLREAPGRCKVRRLDETAAARNPCLTG
ncbi:MAG: aminomethyl-transferring glycine dehydrogenase subunit GcvPB [Deltaproteobacteria bacterium]|nr:aminomethyl-transferring glycine dehydrogenase subunit GcvPB [Deltaproteobacteria bacterium]